MLLVISNNDVLCCFLISLESIWKDFWSFATCSSDDQAKGHLTEEKNNPKNTTKKAYHSPKMYEDADELTTDNTDLHNDMEEKQLQIVEDDSEEPRRNRLRGNLMRLNSSDQKCYMKIAGKFALKFRELIRFDCIQIFVQEADFVLYQKIVDILIPKVCIPTPIYD